MSAISPDPPRRAGRGAGLRQPGQADRLRPSTFEPRAESSLVVALHRCTQNGPGYARDAGWIDLADCEGFVVLAPGQVRSNNPNLCFNWYSRDHAAPDGLEVRSILAMIEAVVEAPTWRTAGSMARGCRRVRPWPSQVMHHPQVFASAGLIAGLPADEAHSLQDALALMKGQRSGRAARPARRVTLTAGQAPTLLVWHGQADRIVVPSKADAIADQWIERAGLSDRPTTTERNGALSRSLWNRPDGALAMETVRIAGFGRATPLATGGPEGIGRAAPHGVKCGMSSTLPLAQSWGIAAPVGRRASVDAGSAAGRPSAQSAYRSWHARLATLEVRMAPERAPASSPNWMAGYRLRRAI